MAARAALSMGLVGRRGMRTYATAASPVTVTVFTKAGCTLCDVVTAVLASPRAPPHTLQQVDIAAPGNEAWLAKYGHDIPVLFLGDRYYAKHRVDRDAFFEALQHGALAADSEGEPRPELPRGPAPPPPVDTHHRHHHQS